VKGKRTGTLLLNEMHERLKEEGKKIRPVRIDQKVGRNRKGWDLGRKV